LLLLDGLGDYAYETLGHQTPLQAASTPNFDRLAALGSNGTYHAGAHGQALPSEIAHFAMFGYDFEDFPGRGALESVGAGIPLGEGEVAILAHFVGIREENKQLFLKKDKVKIPQETIQSFIEAVGTYETNGVRIRFRQTKGTFGILTLRGEVSPFVTDTNPMLEGSPLSELLPWQQYANDPATQRTAKALKAYLVWVYKTLKEHPENLARVAEGLPPVAALVTQRPGRMKRVKPFREQNGIRGLSVASAIIYWGISAFLGLDVREVRDHDDPAQELEERLRIAREALSDGYDFVHVHTKWPDEAGHRKDPLEKKQIIEALDKGFGKHLEALLADPEVLTVVASDHSTPSSGPLVHSGETVPVIFCGPGVRRDNVMRYDEVSAAAGALGCVRGKEFMYLILNHLERAKLMSIMDTPVDQPYWPGDYMPFTLED